MTTARLPASVVLLASGPPMSLKVLYCLHRLGIPTDVIDVGSPSIVRHSRYRRHYARVRLQPSNEGGTEASLLAFLQPYIEERRIEGILGGDISSSGMLHAIRDQLPNVVVFPTSDRKTLDLLDDKWQFQQFMVEHDIPCPAAALLETMDNAPALVSSIGFPLVVKPMFGESGHGIARVDDLGALAAHVASGSKYARLPLILQQFVPGGDADISILAIAGRVVCHVIHAREAGCTLRFMENREALQVAERIVAETNYTGVANIDVRLGPGGSVSVLECNPRFWYTLQASLWRGVNFVEAGFKLASGDEANTPAPSTGTYHLHGCLLKSKLWKPSQWHSIEAYNLRGLAQAMTDPLPFLRS